MDRPSVYLETTVVSYLVARPSPDVFVVANQLATRQWWDHERARFEVFVSQAVIDEISLGDPEMAQRRLNLVRNLPILIATDEAFRLANHLMLRARVPPKAATDALHVAVAAVHRIDFLLTWNCTHIANTQVRVLLESACREAGFVPPAIGTPAELMEHDAHEDRPDR